VRTDNEYRIILFTINNENIRNSTEIVLLNSFIKKSNDYTKPINQAKTIKENFIENEYKQQQI
jgi:hypothetical protein